MTPPRARWWLIPALCMLLAIVHTWPLASAPGAWLGGSPVLVFNLVLILGFALTAWAGARLVESWTGDQVAGLLAGSMIAFNTHTLTRLAHMQGIHAWGLPLALLSADRIITRTWLRDA